MRRKNSTQYLSTKPFLSKFYPPVSYAPRPLGFSRFSRFVQLLCGVLAGLPSRVRAGCSGGPRGPIRVSPAPAPPLIPGFPPSGRPDPARVGGPARFARRGAGPGPRGAPAADVFGHE